MIFGRAYWRLAVVLILLLGTETFVQTHRRTETIPHAEQLSGFPMQVGAWSGHDLLIDSDTRQVLGPGDFLSRNYVQPSAPPIGLFIAYFPSQRTGDTIHSPKNCLPGAGWVFLESGTAEIPTANRRTRVGRYVIGKGSDRQLVLYWYQAHGRVVTSEYWARVYLVTDSIRMNRTDGSLVRVMTPILSGEGENAAEARAVSFVTDIARDLPRFIPN